MGMIANYQQIADEKLQELKIARIYLKILRIYRKMKM